jgi:hypothetical protein
MSIASFSETGLPVNGKAILSTSAFTASTTYLPPFLDSAWHIDSGKKISLTPKKNFKYDSLN